MVELRPWTSRRPDGKAFLAASFEAWEEVAAKAHTLFVPWRNAEVHWAPLRTDLARSRVALVTTGGVHHRDDAPFDTSDERGDASVRRLPGDVDTRELVVTHTHYNHGDADRDINCVLPLDRLREAAAAGRVGELAPTHYGLMGFAPDPRPMLQEAAPRIVEGLVAEQVDVVVLSPG